jgi:hypothetical protein
MAAAFLSAAGGSVVPAGACTLAQALSASEAFQPRAASSALFGSEGAAAPVSVHCGGMLTEIHLGGTSTPLPVAPVSAG